MDHSHSKTERELLYHEKYFSSRNLRVMLIISLELKTCIYTDIGIH